METVKLIRVFIASPGDTLEERDEIEKIIYRWNRLNVNHREVVLMPVRWEYDSTASYGFGYSGQRKINEQILFDSDILIAVFYKKLGTKVDGYESGTVAEIENFYTRKQDGVGVFFKKVESFSPEELDEYYRLDRYKKTLFNRGLFQAYTKENIERYLEVEISKLLSSTLATSKKDTDSFKGEVTDIEETGMDLYLVAN